MKSSTKQRNAFISLAVIALVILVGGWFYMNAQPSTAEVVSDKASYFANDNPEVSVKLLNPKEANAGNVKISFDSEVLNLLESTASDGVTVKELKDTIGFDLSKEYFDSKNQTLAVLEFEILKPGVAEIKVDENSYLTIKGEESSFEKIEDLSIEVSIAPTREHGGSIGESGEHNSI
jgi:hypothetical protein